MTDRAPIFAIVCMFYAIYTGVPMFVLTHESRVLFAVNAYLTQPWSSRRD